MSVAARADDWRADMRRSAKAFQEIVWPEIVDYVRGGNFCSLETGRDDLDRTGGIDGYQILRTTIRTIAQRTQFTDDYPKPSTFTVRCSRQSGAATELTKRGDAIDQGFDLPGLVIQAYVHEGSQQLDRVGITHGRPFYNYVRANLHRWREVPTNDGSARFLVVPWYVISIDNGTGLSEVPFLGKNGLGVVYRTPDCWFSARPNVFDQDARYFSHTRRDRGLLWI